MEFQLLISSPGQTFTLPLTSGLQVNATVEWGDGQSDTITSATAPERVHTYASTGFFNVKMSGLVEGWTLDNAADAGRLNQITRIGNVGLQRFNAHGASGWTGAIPAGFFSAIAGTVDDLSSAFNATGVTTFTEIPGGVTDVADMFRDAPIVATEYPAIPAGVTDARGIFSGLTGVTASSFPALPAGIASGEDIFENNSGCTAAAYPVLPTGMTAAAFMFSGCSGITASSFPVLPPNLSNANRMFNGNSGVTASSFPTLPATLSNANSMFANCSSVTATALPTLGASVSNANAIFLNAASVTTIGGAFDASVLINDYRSSISGTAITAAEIDAWLISIDNNNVSTGTRRILYANLAGAQLDSARSSAAAQALENMLATAVGQSLNIGGFGHTSTKAGNWIRTGTY